MTKFNKNMYYKPSERNPKIAHFSSKDIEELLTKAGYTFKKKDVSGEPTEDESKLINYMLPDNGEDVLAMAMLYMLTSDFRDKLLKEAFNRNKDIIDFLLTKQEMPEIAKECGVNPLPFFNQDILNS